VDESSARLGNLWANWRLSTVGDHALPVAAARILNSLPQPVMPAPSMSVFRGHLKAFLMMHCPRLLPQLLQCLGRDSCHFRTLKSLFFTQLTYLPKMCLW